jgi:hypothetical protein
MAFPMSPLKQARQSNASGDSIDNQPLGANIGLAWRLPLWKVTAGIQNRRRHLKIADDPRRNARRSNRKRNKEQKEKYGTTAANRILR